MKITFIGAAFLSAMLVSGQAGWAQTAPDPGAVQSVSTARIVRLSLVQGTAELDRNTGRGYEAAFANIPIVQGLKLRTQFDGLAEVEFEDNSTLRLTPGTVVSFEQLGRSANGATLTRVRVEQGTAYVSLHKSKANAFTLLDEQTAIELMPGSRVRLQAMRPTSELAVFEGHAELAPPDAPPVVVGKKDTMVFDPAAQTVASVDHKTEPQKFDDWDKNQAQYHMQKASFTGSSGLGAYGANDLMYYGSFSNLGGCGMAWRPYFASAAWDPFANGTWALYPGAGYSWVSPYPWGWLPFHSGMWQMCGGAGWAWMPNNSWYGLGNTAIVNAGSVARRLVPHLPGVGRSTLVPVNATRLPSSGLEGNETFVFRRDSAGMGVPRGTFGGLRQTSGDVLRQQQVRTTVQQIPMGAGRAGMAPGQGFSRMEVPGGAAGRTNAERNAGRDGGPAPGMGARPGGWESMGGARTSSMPARGPASAPAANPGAAAGGAAHH